jgi:hypothetical protein
MDFLRALRIPVKLAAQGNKDRSRHISFIGDSVKYSECWSPDQNGYRGRLDYVPIVATGAAYGPHRGCKRAVILAVLSLTQTFFPSGVTAETQTAGGESGSTERSTLADEASLKAIQAAIERTQKRMSNVSVLYSQVLRSVGTPEYNGNWSEVTNLILMTHKNNNFRHIISPCSNWNSAVPDYKLSDSSYRYIKDNTDTKWWPRPRLAFISELSRSSQMMDWTDLYFEFIGIWPSATHLPNTESFFFLDQVINGITSRIDSIQYVDGDPCVVVANGNDLLWFNSHKGYALCQRQRLTSNPDGTIQRRDYRLGCFREVSPDVWLPFFCSLTESYAKPNQASEPTASQSTHESMASQSIQILVHSIVLDNKDDHTFEVELRPGTIIRDTTAGNPKILPGGEELIDETLALIPVKGREKVLHTSDTAKAFSPHWWVVECLGLLLVWSVARFRPAFRRANPKAEGEVGATRPSEGV